MIRKEHEGMVWLEFELLSQFPKLKHGVFLRHGGYSHGDFDSLNLSFNVGDLAISVKSNENKVAQSLRLSSIVRGHVVHGKTIVAVNKNSPGTIETSSDGIATHETNVGLLMTHADCQAAIFYDPIKHVLANVHAGWRGSVQDIYGETIAFMQKTYQSDPKDIHVAISPSLGPYNSEFVNYKEELPEHFWEFQIKPDYFDFWSISRMQLIGKGIHSDHIQIAEISTYSNPQDYFSYRRDKKAGRHGTVAALV